MKMENVLGFCLEEIKNKGISKRELSQVLGINYSSLHRKLSGEIKFTLSEFFAIVSYSEVKLLILKGEIDEIIGNS